MLQVVEVKKNFKGIPIVDNIDFKVYPGEIVGLLGENGAGKTTILRMISTMLKISAGKIYVNSIDVSQHPQKARENIGILYGGDVGLYERLTGRENIEYYGKLNRMSKSEIELSMNKLIKEFKMEDYIDIKVGKYSRGMKQKVSIARSIVHDPPIMLLDEPTTGLDVGARAVIQKYIMNCKKDKKVILLSSHSMKEVERLCDRVVIINKGRQLENCTISQLKEIYDNKDLESVFLQLINGGEYEQF